MNEIKVLKLEHIPHARRKHYIIMTPEGPHMNPYGEVTVFNSLDYAYSVANRLKAIKKG